MAIITRETRPATLTTDQAAVIYSLTPEMDLKC